MATDELYGDKLRLIFERLFTQTRYRVQDDTLLQKLRDLLKNTLSPSEIGTPTAIRRRIILEVVESVPWILTLAKNHQLLDCHVTAFGLAIVGDLAVIDACHPTLMANAECLKIFLCDLSVRYIGLHASLRCSIMTTLKSVWMAKSDLRDSLLSGMDVSDILRNGLMDGSIFVAREAKELAVYYLISELKTQGLQSTDRECFKVLDWLTGFVRETSIESDRNALIALEVFGDVIRRNSSVTTRLCQVTKLKVAAMDRLLNSENEGICNSCCLLLVSLNSWSFEMGIPSEWMVVLEMLLSKPVCPLTTAATFVVTTCQKLRTDLRLQLPIGLTSLLTEPITICFEWNAEESGTNSLQHSKWWLPIQENRSDLSGLVKLCSYSLVSVSKMHDILSNEEKLHFIKMLTFVLMETGNLLTLSPKIQTSLLSVLASLLEETCDKGDSNGLPLTVDDRLEIWRNVIKAAEQPSSSALVSTKRMLLIRILVRGTSGEGLQTVWEDVGARLTQLLQKRCHDLLWEVRDSGIETFGEIIQKSNDHQFLSNWCVTCGLLNVLIASMDDVEVYVKASILQVLSILPTVSAPQVYAEATQLLPLGRLIAIVLMDDEGVVRRAGAKALMSWSFATKLRKSSLCHVANAFLIASADLDWEVKLISVDFWKTTLINSIETESDLLETLMEIGFCDAMMHLAADQDVSVRHEMATLVRRLKELPVIEKHLKPTDKKDDARDTAFAECRPPTVFDAEFEPMTDDAKYAAIDKVLDTVDSNLVNDVMVYRTEQPVFSATVMSDENDTKLDRLISNHHRFHRERITAPKFLRWLRELDLDVLLTQSDRTTDIYETNPEALLDDLIVAHDEESETEDEISLDCY